MYYTGIIIIIIAYFKKVLYDTDVHYTRKICQKAKALVCRTSYAGEEPEAILLNDRQNITLCPHRGSAIMEQTDSCEGFIVFTYLKDVLLCDVCKNTSKQTKRKLSSELGSDSSKNCRNKLEKLQEADLEDHGDRIYIIDLIKVPTGKKTHASKYI